MKDFDILPLELFECLSSITEDYLCVVDFYSNTIYWSESAADDLLLPRKGDLEKVKQQVLSKIHPDDKIDKFSDVSEYRIKDKNNKYIWIQSRISVKYNEDGSCRLCVGILKKLGSDFYEENRTGYLPMSAFRYDITEKIENCTLNGCIMDFCLGDIRQLNTIYSYSFVNKVFSAISKELSLLCPENGKLYRVQGNHILLYYPDAEKNDIISLCNKISTVVPVRIHKNKDLDEININMSCAVAMINDIDPLNFDNLWKRLTYCSALATKKRIYDKPLFFSPEKFKNAVTKLELIDELKYAVNNNIDSFMLYYQPIINPATDKLRSAEALLRWNNPLLKKFGLPEIIKQLENTGLILPLGRWIIKTALKELKRWQKYYPEMHININIAVPQLNDYDLTNFIANELRKNNISGSSVTFEITETYQIKDMNSAVKFVNAIHAIGAEVALDDFGTGNCSLSELKILPIDWIKVDQGFVLDIAENKIDQSILKHLMDLSHSLDINICVEGVGSRESLEIVQQYLPETVQGYHYSTPLPQEEFFETFIKNIK